MFAKINHLAIVSENYAALAQFYQGVFGMKTSGRTRPGCAITVGDGYIGLNINPHLRPVGLGIGREAKTGSIFSGRRARSARFTWPIQTAC